MIIFGLLAVLSIACGAMLIIFSFIDPPSELSFVRDIEFYYLTRYIPGGLQRFLVGMLLIFGVPFLLFGVFSNHL
jgi:hypothetical protein